MTDRITQRLAELGMTKSEFLGALHAMVDALLQSDTPSLLTKNLELATALAEAQKQVALRQEAHDDLIKALRAEVPKQWQPLLLVEAIQKMREAMALAVPVSQELRATDELGTLYSKLRNVEGERDQLRVDHEAAGKVHAAVVGELERQLDIAQKNYDHSSKERDLYLTRNNNDANTIRILREELAKQARTAPLPDPLKLTEWEVSNLANAAALHSGCERVTDDVVPFVESLIAARVLKPMSERSVGHEWNAARDAIGGSWREWDELTESYRVALVNLVNACRVGIGTSERDAEVRDLCRQLAEALEFSDGYQSERNALQEELEAEQTGYLELRKRFGARDNETMGQFVERLASTVAHSPALGAEMTNEERAEFWCSALQWQANNGEPTATGVESRINAMLARRLMAGDHVSDDAVTDAIAAVCARVTPPQPTGNAGELTMDQSDRLHSLAVSWFEAAILNASQVEWIALITYVASLRAELAGEVERLRTDLGRREKEGTDAYIAKCHAPLKPFKREPGAEWLDEEIENVCNELTKARVKLSALAPVEPTEEEFAEWCQVYWPLSEDGSADLDHGRQAFRAARAGVRPRLRELSEDECIKCLSAAIVVRADRDDGIACVQAGIDTSAFARAILQAAQEPKS